MKGNVAEVSERKFRLLSQHVSLEHLTIVTSLGGYIFSGCTNLSSVTIGANVQFIGEYALLACSLLTSIEYKDKKKQWNSITKGNNWYLNTGNFTIHCSDGDLSKQ